MGEKLDFSNAFKRSTTYDDSEWLWWRRQNNMTGEIPGQRTEPVDLSASCYSIECIDVPVFCVGRLSYGMKLGEFLDYIASKHPEVRADVAPWLSMRDTPLVRVFGRWLLLPIEQRLIDSIGRPRMRPLAKYRHGVK